jgi:predicted small lipoprotein YifL
VRRTVSILPLWLLLAGCGMYGSLYLEQEDTELQPAEVTELPPVAVEPDEERPARNDDEDPAGEP